MQNNTALARNLSYLSRKLSQRGKDTVNNIRSNKLVTIRNGSSTDADINAAKNVPKPKLKTNAVSSAANLAKLDKRLSRISSKISEYHDKNDASSPEIQKHINTLATKRATLLVERDKIMRRTAQIDPMYKPDDGEDDLIPANDSAFADESSSDVADDFGDESDMSQEGPDDGISDEGIDSDYDLGSEDDMSDEGLDEDFDEGLLDEDEEGAEGAPGTDDVADAIETLLKGYEGLDVNEVLSVLQERLGDETLDEDLSDPNSFEEDDEDLDEELDDEEDEGSEENAEHEESESEENEEESESKPPKSESKDKDKDKEKAKPKDKKSKPEESVLDADLMVHKRSSVSKGRVTASYYPSPKNISKACWVVSVDQKPTLRVFASRAYPDLTKKPEPGSLGTGYNFPTYLHAFASKDYGTALVENVFKGGVQKTASSCHGQIIKAAQIGNSGLSQPTITPSIENSTNPRSNTQTPPLPSQSNGGGTPEGDANSTLNPSEAAQDDAWDTDIPAILPIKDVLVDILAPFAANGTYQVSGIVDEIKTMASDDEAMAEFEGTLGEKVDSMVSEAKNTPEDEDTDEVDLGTPDNPEAVTGPPGSDMSRTQPGASGLPSMAMVNKVKRLSNTNTELLTKISELESVNSKLMKEREIKFRFEAAKRWIVEEEQPRGLVSTVESKIRENPTLDKQAAFKLVNAEIVNKAKDLVVMDEKSLGVYKAQITRVPYAEVIEEAPVTKTASVNNLGLLALGQERSTKVGMEAILEGIELGSPKTELARAHNEARKSSRSRF